MADAATAKNNPSALQTAALLGENKALAQRGPKPISAARPLPEPAPALSQPADQTNSPNANRVENLKTQRQQAMRQKQQEQPEPANAKQPADQKKKDKKRFARRDQVNDLMDKAMIATIAGFWTAIFALIWFNLKLIWGGLVMKNKSRFVSEPSMRPFKASFLPKWLAYGAILGADLFVIAVVLIAIFVLFLVIRILIELASNPLSYFTSSDVDMIRPLLGQ